MNVFDLFAKISLDTEDYDKSLGETEEKTSSFASSLGGGMKKAAKVGVAAVGAVTAATTLAGKSIYKNAKQTAAYGDTVDKMSQKVGMSSDAYQEWDYVLNISGTDMASTAVGLRTLTNKLESAKGGSDSAKETFEKLGLSLEDISDMSREDLFAEVITAFQGMEDSTERAALANELFGRSGQQLIPLFNTSAKETKKIREEARKYGAVMSKDAVKASATFNDRLTRMNSAMSGVKKNISSSFLPGLTTIVEGFADLVEGNEGANEALEEGFTATIDALSGQLPNVLKAGVNIVDSLAKGIVNNLPKLSSAGLDIILGIVNSIIDGLPNMISVGTEVLTNVITGISNALPQLIPKAAEAIATIAQGLADNADKLIDAAAKAFKALIEGLSKAVPVIIKALPKVLKTLAKAIGDNLGTIIQTVAPALIAKKAGTAVFSGLKSGIGGIKDKLLGFLKGPGGPITAVIGAFAALGAAIAADMEAAYQDAYDTASKLSESEQALVDAIHEEAEKWDDVHEARKDKAADVEAEINTYKDLYGRLKNIVDENGKVKKGYEEEAKLITGKLSEALDIELEYIDGQIEGYDGIRDSIDKVIEKKEAQLLLQAHEEEYTEAVKNLRKAEKKRADAAYELSEQEKKVAEATQKVNELEKKYKTAQDNARAGVHDHGESLASLERKLKAAKGELEGATKKLDDFKTANEEAEDTVKEYQIEIGNYDALMDAVANGSLSDIDQAINNLNDSMLTAKTGTAETLKEQTIAFAEELGKQSKLFNDTGDEIYQEAADDMSELVDRSLSELRKLDPNAAAELGKLIRDMKAYYSDFNNTGDYLISGVAQGVKTNSYKVKNAATSAVADALRWAEQEAGVHSPSTVWRDKLGKMLGAGIAVGLEDSEKLVRSAAENLLDVAEPDVGYDTEYEVLGSPDAEGYGGGAITINVYGAEGQDIGSLADEIAIRLQKMYRREVAKYA